MKDVRFGSLWIKAPHSPENYLTWQYGKSWSYEGVQDRTHRGGPVNRVRFTMTEEDLRPAEPFGPLKDRVQR